ncbi:MAG: hypothetical protein IKN53_04250, partial [Oscillibacter sp.]|nr:hypothetical protein [Oscillibacter sp.]
SAMLVHGAFFGAAAAPQNDPLRSILPGGNSHHLPEPPHSDMDVEEEFDKKTDFREQVGFFYQVKCLGKLP